MKNDFIVVLLWVFLINVLESIKGKITLRKAIPLIPSYFAFLFINIKFGWKLQ